MNCLVLLIVVSIIMAHTEAEATQLAAMFDQLQFKPRADTPEDLVKSLVDWLVQKGKVEVTPEEPPQRVKQEPGVIDWTRNPPRFSTFSGASPKPSSHVDIESWLYDVQCAQDEGAPAVTIMQAIRRSLGEPAKTRLRVGKLSTPEEVIKDFKAHFAPQTSQETLVSQFIAAVQTDTESVSSWNDRLDHLVVRIKEKGGAQMVPDDAVRTRFWKGLHSPELKAATRVSYDLKIPYAELVKVVRREEEELALTAPAKKQAKSHQAQVGNDPKLTSVLDQMQATMSAMETRLNKLEKGQIDSATGGPPSTSSNTVADSSKKKKRTGGSGKCYKCDAPWVKGHRQVCPALNGQ